MAVNMDPHRLGRVGETRTEPTIGPNHSALDATLPPTPLKDLLAAGGASVFVLSSDPELAQVVQRAGGDQYPVYAVQDWRELIAAVEDGRCGIALVDASAAQPRLDKRLAELERYADRLVILVAAAREEAEGMIGLLSERRIHRLLIKPAALGITRLLLESAVGRCIQMRDQADGERVSAAHDAPSLRKRSSKAGRPWTWTLSVLGIVVALGALLVVALNTFWRPSDVTAVAPAGGARIAAAAPEVADDRFTALLAQAEQAFVEGRLAEPPGDNALDYYLTILAAEPAHVGARERIETVVEALFAQAEAALLAESHDDAAAVLDSVRRAQPASARLAFLDTQLQRARAGTVPAADGLAGEPQPSAAAARDAASSASASAAGPPTADERSAGPGSAGAPERSAVAGAAPSAPAATTASATPPTELDSLITLGRMRIQRGQLLEPAGDSALEYATRAAALAPNDARVGALRRQLSASVVTAARERMAANDQSGAAALIEGARVLGAGADDLSGLDLEMSNALLAAARERLQSGALVEPATDSAYYYLDQLRARAPDADVGDAWEQLEVGLIDSARRAFMAGDLAASAAWLDWVDRVSGSSAAARELRGEIDFRRQQAAFLAQAVPASELELLSFEPPAYPDDAIDDQIEGWVELELIVDTQGRPRAVEALASEPQGRFEQAALAAVSRYRYRPFTFEGRVYERRLRLRVRFTLR